MKYRNLGNNLTVSEIGLGCMGMSHAYGEPADENDMIYLIDKAIDLGVNFFDTAEVYGPYQNEKLLGKAFKGKRDKVKIATKFGISLNNRIITPDSRSEKIRESIEGSLKRLNTDYIDLYYQHRIDPNVPIEEVVGVLKDLMKEGKVLNYGLSEVDVEQLKRAHSVSPVACIQNRYSMMYRENEYALFDILKELNVGFVAFSPLANGVLSDKYNKESKFNSVSDFRSTMPQFQPDSYDKNKQLFDLLRNIAEERLATPAQISLAWVLGKGDFIVPIPGTTKLHRLEENSNATNICLTTDEVKKIDDALESFELSDVYGGFKK